MMLECRQVKARILLLRMTNHFLSYGEVLSCHLPTAYSHIDIRYKITKLYVSNNKQHTILGHNVA
jgi:hypothetical protein